MSKRILDVDLIGPIAVGCQVLVGHTVNVTFRNLYKACPYSKDTKVLNMYNIFNLQK